MAAGTGMMLPVIDRMDGVQNVDRCKLCGGMCCNQAAGIAFPDDFGSVETLQAVLESYLRTGFWAVDWWEGDVIEGGELGRIYYIRPAHTNRRGRLRDPSWGGTCVLWSPDHGCSLEFRHRPRTCRLLKPMEHEGGDCIGAPSKEDACLAWRPFQAQLVAALETVEAEQ